MYYKQPGLSGQGLAPQKQSSSVEMGHSYLQVPPKKVSRNKSIQLVLETKKRVKISAFLFFLQEKCSNKHLFFPHMNTCTPSSGRNLAELLKPYQPCQSLDTVPFPLLLSDPSYSSFGCTEGLQGRPKGFGGSSLHARREL